MKTRFLIWILAGVLLAFLWNRLLTKRPAPEFDVESHRRQDSPPFTLEPEAAGNSPHTPDVQTESGLSLLRKLSDIALYIQSGKSTLSELRRGVGEPDKTMWLLRLSAHESPEARRELQKYLLSDHVPLPARILLAFALAQSADHEVTEILISSIDLNNDVQVAIAACLTFSASANGGIGRGWNGLMAHLQELTACEYFSRGEGDVVFVPKGELRRDELCFTDLDGVDLSEAARRITGLLLGSDFQSFRGVILNICRQLSERSECTDLDRLRLRDCAIESYLKGDSAWYDGLTILIKRRNGSKPENLDIVSAGLQTLSPEQRAIALERVAGAAPKALFTDHFMPYLPGCLEYLAKTPDQGGSSSRELTQLCWSLVVESTDKWAVETIAGHDSEPLKERVSEVLKIYARSGAVFAANCMSLCDALLLDNNSTVRFNTAQALASWVQQKRKPMSPSDSQAVRDHLRAWIKREEWRGLQRDKREKLEAIRAVIVRQFP